MELALRNARIVARDEDFLGSLLVRDGVIVAVDRGAGRVGEDMDGDVLMPGVIDIHTDNLERCFFPRPNIDWNPVSAAVTHDAACVSVGVTTIFDSLTIGAFNGAVSRAKDNLTRLTDGLSDARAKGMLKADHFIHWRCETTADDLSERLALVADHPLAAMFSLMDHTPGQRQYRNLDRYLENWRAGGMTDEAMDTRLAECRERQSRNTEPNRRLVAEVARARNVPLISHDDEDADQIDLAADLGATVSEFPVTLEAAERARARGMIVVMGGPNLIRGGSYSGNVPAADLAERGLLDAFASDYVPRSLVECAFALASAPFAWPLAKAVATVTAAAAAAGGLPDRGALEPGLRADMVRVRPVAGLPIVRGVWTSGARAA